MKPRPLPYPHLRIGHIGASASFSKVAPHFDVREVDLDRELQSGFDMLLVEPDIENRANDLTEELMDRFEAAQIPIVYFARCSTHLDHPLLSRVNLILCEEPELATAAKDSGAKVLHILPSIDDTIHNPIGWKHQPSRSLLVISESPNPDGHFSYLDAVAEVVDLYGAAIPGIEPLKHNPDRPAGKNQVEVSHDHLAAHTSPYLSATPTSQTQQTLEHVAAGTPVIAAPNPTLDSLLPGHYLPINTPTDMTRHFETLSHPPSRERHSVPARRHVLNNHTRTHRFEQILQHIDIPTKPPPKISILLATKRPQNIEHALTNITRQEWPNKELILILHGPEHFDTTHIQTLINQLDYTTKLITCPTSHTLGDCLNTGLDNATGQYITKMDDDDHYGPHHLTDLHTAHTYAHPAITGKWGNVVFLSESARTIDYRVDREERYVTHLPGATMFAATSTLRAFRFNRVMRGVDRTLLDRVLEHGQPLFSTHRFGFIRVRHSDHTFERDESVFIKGARDTPRDGLEIDSAMI